MIWKTITRFNMFWTLLLEPDGVDINWFLHSRNKIDLKSYIKYIYFESQYTPPLPTSIKSLIYILQIV